MTKVKSDAETFMVDDAVNPKRNGLFNRNAGNVDGLFDRPATTYNKGGAVLHTLREQIGDQAFWKGVNAYLNRHKFANVESTDLQEGDGGGLRTRPGLVFRPMGLRHRKPEAGGQTGIRSAVQDVDDHGHPDPEARQIHARGLPAAA